MKQSIFTVLFTLAMAATASAACQCMCVANQKQWICTNTYDVPAGFCSGYCSGR